MKKHKRRYTVHKKKYLLIAILVVFSCLGFAYSFLNKELNILGTITVKKQYAPTLYNILRKETEENGLGIDDYFADMLSNNLDSRIKLAVEGWYKQLLYDDFDSFIEDAIYCNNRTITNYNGWSTTGSLSEALLTFKENSIQNDLSCPRVKDRFSTLNNQAQTNYKAGLMTASEMNLLNNHNAIATGQRYWLLSPSYVYEPLNSSEIDESYGYIVDENGNIVSAPTPGDYGLRPTITLVPEIKYISGDGSMANPYIAETR